MASTSRSSSSAPAPRNGQRPFKSIQSTSSIMNSLAKRDKGKGKAAGTERPLPGLLDIDKFITVRTGEIQAFQNAIKAAFHSGNARCFQSLPRHLRRRAASHNPRRVPKRMRARAAAEIDPGDNIAKRHRKRAKLRAMGNLRGESRTEQLSRRQRNKTWLPTHIWHAKRFHMTNLWSHRLPLTPTFKSFRSAYRASRRRAIVHDTSYFGIIELRGEREELVHLLGSLAGGPFAGERYESGTCLAEVMLYHCFPLGMIGPAEIIWKSQDYIWIRIHPSIFEEVWSALKSHAPRFSALSIHDLRTEVDSFEIMGPLAGRILRRVFRLVKSENPLKHEFFAALHNPPAEIPDGLIAGLEVYDPRLHFPPPKTYTLPTPSSSSVPNYNTQLAQSQVWDENTREDLSTPKYTKADLDRRRQKIGLPGTRLRPLAQDARIPLLLIRKTIGTSSSSAIHGYTMLLPRGWSQYLLTSFTYAGCMVGGLEERRVQHREAGVPCFPEHYGQVCKAGSEWEISQAKIAEATWTRKPPAKRPQWNALGTRWPFRPDWTEILTTEEDILNGGDTPKPWLLPSSFNDFIPHMLSDPAAQLLKVINAFRSQRSLPSFERSRKDELLNGALIHVRVDMFGRGSPSDMAIIYTLDAPARAAWLKADQEDQDIGRVAWDSLADEGKSTIQRLGEERADNTDVIGFVNTGNFSLSRGEGFGLATVTLKSYLQLLAISVAVGDTHQAVAKVRNRDGTICRLAHLTVQ